MQYFLNWFTRLYPVWLVGTALLAFFWPPSMLWFSGQWIVWALSLSMLGMGLTLSPKDFQGILKMPGSVTLGFVCQYTVMPLMGWGIAKALQLEPGFAVGLILVASCPGGMASNMISFLARANLALSVVLTMVSTMMAFIATPLWTSALAGQYVPVDAVGLCLSTLQAVIAPIVIGVLCNWKFPKTVARVSPFGPAVAVLALSLITGGIVAASAPKIAENFGTLVLATFALHVIGFAIGYLVPRSLKYPEQVSRTVSIEVGIQNGESLKGTFYLSNKVECPLFDLRSPRYFDSNDVNGYQNCRTVMTYDGAGRVLSRTDAPGTPEAATESYTNR